MKHRRVARYLVLVVAVCLGPLSVFSQVTQLKVLYGSAPPMTFRSGSGSPAGFAVELLEEAARREKLRLDWRFGGTIESVDDALRSATLDLVPTGIETPERLRDFYFTSPWWSSDLVVVSSANPSTLDARPPRAGVPAIGHSLAQKTFPGSTISPFPNASAAVMAICRGEIDQAMILETSLRELLAAPSEACKGFGLKVNPSAARLEYRLLTRRDLQPVVDRLRLRIDEITADGTLASIAARNPMVSSSKAIQMAELLRAVHGKRTARTQLILALCATASVICVAFWQYRSRSRLRRVNRALEKARSDRERSIAELKAEHDRLVIAEESTRESEQRWNFALEGAGDGVWDWDAETGVTFYSRQWKAMLGFEEEEIGSSLDEFEDRLHPEDRERVLATIQRQLGGGSPIYSTEYRLRCKNGSYKWILARGKVVRWSANGAAARAIGTHTDLTPIKQGEAERERLHAQFLQAQKMESLGRLAGGIAHDFNNLLTVINGYSALLRGRVGDGLREQVDAISDAGERARILVRQLLAFSRKEAPARENVDLNGLLDHLHKTVLRLVGDDVTILTCLAPSLPPVVADPHQLEQALINMAINARDAMPQGGQLTISTGPPPPGEQCVLCNQKIERDAFLCVTVRDTGTGMSQETLEHLFEPFFTTKPAGKGTGLGLAVVRGVVLQNGGHIAVQTALGSGTEFRLFLPRARGEMKIALDEPAAVGAGTETILVVEDDDAVRRYALQALAEYGYRTLEASSGAVALELLESEQPHLVVSDLTMPDMNGLEVIQRARASHPNIKALLMSGHLGDHHSPIDVESIQKPFTAEELAGRARQILARQRSRILIADDDDGVRAFLRSVLESAGYEVDDVVNGLEALTRVQANPPDLVIMDLVMPEKEGLETISELRQQHPSIGILAISGAVGGRYLAIAKHLGADGALPKPMSAAELLREVQRVLQRTAAP